MHASKHQRGFTIVELLIVVVIIAILAAITIAAFNGVQRRANESASASAVNSAVEKLELYKTTNNIYPPNLSDASYTATGNTTTEYTQLSAGSGF